MSRLSFDFVGTCNTPLSVDPKEYVGMTVPQVSAELLKLLAAIAPGVNFFPQDVLEAANDVACTAE